MDESICRAGIEMQVLRMDIWTWWKEGNELGDWGGHIYTNMCKAES